MNQDTSFRYNVFLDVCFPKKFSFTHQVQSRFDLEVVGLSSSFHLDAFPPNRAHFPSWDSSRKMESDATAAPWEIFKENAQPIKRGRDTKRLGR